MVVGVKIGERKWRKVLDYGGLIWYNTLMKNFHLLDRVEYIGCLKELRGYTAIVLGKEQYPNMKEERYMIDFEGIDFYLHDVDRRELRLIG